MGDRPGPTAADRERAAASPAGSPAPRSPASASPHLEIWRLHSPGMVASPASRVFDDGANPQQQLSVSWQTSPPRHGARAAGHFTADCLPLSAQGMAQAASASDAAVAATAAASLQARFAPQPASIPEHTVSPPSALPASLLAACDTAGSRSYDAAAATLRDSCPAASGAPRLTEDMPLRQVAGSAEWPARRAPRLMLEIPNSHDDANLGRYCDVNMMQTPGAGLGTASPAPAMTPYSDGTPLGAGEDSMLSARSLPVGGWRSCNNPLAQQAAIPPADIARPLPAPPRPQLAETPCMDERGRELFPQQHSGRPLPPRPSAEMPPPPPRLPLLRKGGSGPLSCSSTPKVGDTTSNTVTPAGWWQSVRSSMSFVTGAFGGGPSGTKSESPKEQTPCDNGEQALLSPEDYSNADAFVQGFEVDVEAASEDSETRPVDIDALRIAAEDGSNGFPPALTAEQKEKLARAIAANSSRNDRASWRHSQVSMSTDCHPLMQRVRGYSGPSGSRPSSMASSSAALNPQPLELARETVERIQTLGTDLPIVHKIFLWVGLIMDLISKGALLFQIQRMARHGLWLNVGMILGGLVLSSAMVTIYWLSHYPSSVADAACANWRPPDYHARDQTGKYKKINLWKGRSVDLSKKDSRRAMRWGGILAAVLQVGSICAAARALKTTPRRQRLVAMDLRGMRLADTIFLTLPVALLQTWIGMRCSHPGDARCFAVWGHAGLNVLLLVGVMASLIGATLAFVSLDLNDLRFAPDGRPWWERRHLWEIVTFFCYRITELGARITLLGLFAVVRGAWVFAIFGGHAIAVLLAIWLWPGRHQAATWRKVVALTDAYVGPCKWGIKLRLPALNDAKLLLAALIWPPSCFVSDATAKTGVFWWRARIGTIGRKPCWSTTLRSALLPFPLYTAIVLVEMGAMYGAVWSVLPSWALRYMQVSLFLSISWLGIGVLWLPIVAICSDQSSSPLEAEHAAATLDSTSNAPMEEGVAKLIAGGKLAPVSELSLDAAAAMSRSSSKAASLGSSGGSQVALSPGAASDTPATGEDLIRAVHSLKDITALHASIEVQPLTPPLLRRVQQDTQEVAERARGEWLRERKEAVQKPRYQRDDSGGAAAEAQEPDAGPARQPGLNQRRSIEITADCRAASMHWPPSSADCGFRFVPFSDRAMAAASGQPLSPGAGSLSAAGLSRSCDCGTSPIKRG